MKIYIFVFYLMFFVAFVSKGHILIAGNLKGGDSGSVMPPEFGDIVFNEVMADPYPTVGLPNFEYIELMNVSGMPVNLKNWKLEMNGKQKVLSDQTINPGGFLIIAGTGGIPIFGTYGACIEVSGLTINNEGSKLKLLTSQNAVIDSFNYSPAMHRKGFGEGGYSLEKIDPYRTCGQETNWETSLATSGGTPGSINSVNRSNQDVTPPAIASVRIRNSSVLEITVSEIPCQASITGKVFSFTTGLPPPDSISFDRKLLKYSLYFPGNSIQNGVDYQVQINNLTDECGNVAPPSKQKFWRYIPAKGDLLISEILFNPFPGGADFVEVYNNSGRVIDLTELFLATRDDKMMLKQVYSSTTTSQLLLSEEYSVFTADKQATLEKYHSQCPACIFEMEKLPSYNDDEGWVVIFNVNTEVVDEFHYLESMQHPLISKREGISLERIDFMVPAGDISNWHSASETVGFATPGYKNSSKRELNEGAEIVSIEPRIFSPNDDGYHDQLQIKLSPGEAGWMANIRIYNQTGVEIRRLANNLMIGSADVIEWDGQTESHRKAGLGIYIVQVYLFNLDGRKRQIKLPCVITDKL